MDIGSCLLDHESRPSLTKILALGRYQASRKIRRVCRMDQRIFLADHDERAKDFYTCLNKISNNQSIAMIDKYYQQHPERLSNNLGSEILLAMTASGGPCEGKNPLSN